MFFTEHAESSQCHSEADSSCPPSWAVQEEPGARHSELQGGGPETEEDHLPAGEGERSLHQWGQRSHAKGMQFYTQWQKNDSKLMLLKQHSILTYINEHFIRCTFVFCTGSLTYGRCQGSRDADFRLQKEDCWGRYQTEAAAELVWGCTKWQELVQQKPHRVSGRFAFITVQ